MQHAQTLCNLSNILLGRKIVTAEGKRVGHVADVVLTPDAPHKVTGLLYGERGWEHRLHILNPFRKVDHAQAKSDIIPWDAVERIERSTIVLKASYSERVKHKLQRIDM